MHTIPKTDHPPADSSQRETDASVGETATESPIVGEGSYEGTRDYADKLDTYLATANVEKDAADAAPNSASEASEMQRAEEEAASRTRAPGK